MYMLITGATVILLACLYEVNINVNVLGLTRENICF